jgi:hypothetical protein
MAKMNLMVDLRAYDGNNANTSRSVFNKNFQQTAINIEREIVQEIEIPANSIKLLFSVSDVTGLPSTDAMPIWSKESYQILNTNDLDYIEINKKMIPSTLILANGRVLAHAGVDYEIQVIGTKTRITWIGSFAQGGDEAIENGETIFLFFSYYTEAQINAQNIQDPTISYDNSNLYKFIYVETDKECEVIINGLVRHTVKPVVVNKVAKNGYFLTSADIDNVYIVNKNNSNIIVYYITSK